MNDKFFRKILNGTFAVTPPGPEGEADRIFDTIRTRREPETKRVNLRTFMVLTFSVLYLVLTLVYAPQVDVEEQAPAIAEYKTTIQDAYLSDSDWYVVDTNP
jgi:hypothetical protein